MFQEDLGLPESSYELCYNAACCLIGQGQLSQAMQKLQKAEGQRSCLYCRVIAEIANYGFVSLEKGNSQQRSCASAVI